ncbi:hypothetical protein HPG69_007728 [Diceros bicornis minor]|uniref:Uncharacterized protein n=1 Tax=Diceros bicornis minor TaxID=77932 RepID=A0A7J7EAF8_DICBM|nr:hypothetical protein HPG69_007728 [Diceros bicornis minor]
MAAALCVTVPGPCDPEDLIDGIIFAANYLGSTQLLSDKTPSKNVRMMQAQEAVSRIKCHYGPSAPRTTEQPHWNHKAIFTQSHRDKHHCGNPKPVLDDLDRGAGPGTSPDVKRCSGETPATRYQIPPSAKCTGSPSGPSVFPLPTLFDPVDASEASLTVRPAVAVVFMAPEGESQPMTEVDLFISTQRIKVLNADTQETMMDHPLRTISYIADIGNIVVLMARRRMPRSNSQENVEASHPSQDGKRQYKMICHVFESEDEFLRANGINPEDLSQKEYSDLLNTQDMYNDDLIHFSKSENCKDVFIEKQKGEILGVVIVESGWGSILPTVIIANMMHGGPAEKSGKLNIGDQIMSINGTSLVGLPLSTCQSIIKGLKNQSRVKLNIVRCPPVTTVLIRRPDLRYQLGFSVQNGIICSLMRGGIAERGGVRVGHRIIEINGQSVVATPHEKIVHILSNAVGEGLVESKSIGLGKQNSPGFHRSLSVSPKLLESRWIRSS